jgi:hypothetical protein
MRERCQKFSVVVTKRKGEEIWPSSPFPRIEGTDSALDPLAVSSNRGDGLSVGLKFPRAKVAGKEKLVLAPSEVLRGALLELLIARWREQGVPGRCGNVGCDVGEDRDRFVWGQGRVCVGRDRDGCVSARTGTGR